MIHHREKTPSEKNPEKKLTVIAIDGPAASGKGTLARNIGAELDFAVLDTGLLYRAVAYLLLESDGDAEDKKAVMEATETLKDHLDTGLLSNFALRSDRVSEAASQISTIPELRQSLLDMQRNFAYAPPNGKKGAILDGRDIGTIVCPDADIKFFVTAEPEIRAERRARQLYAENWPNHYEEMLEKTIRRDKRDRQRKAAPLKPADDAIVLDTSALGIKRVQEVALKHIRRQSSAA